ncbi:MAG: type II secretion system protein [Patescibacteria group bacterium]
MKKTTSGFTIVELLIVIIVIAVLAATTVVAFNGVSARAYDSERHTEARNIQQSLENYYTVNGFYPGVDNLTGSAGVTTLGLSIAQLSSPELPSSGISAGYANQHFNTRYKYVAAPNADGSGLLCSASPCKAYTLGYWAVGENRDYELRHLQRN